MQEAFDRWELLVGYGDGLKELLSLVALCSARALAMMLVLPATSSQKLTGMTRAALPVWLGVYIAWGQPLHAMGDLGMPGLTALILKESLLGVVIGFAASTMFWVAEGAGSMIDNLAGYNNVQQSNPQSSDQSTPIGNLLSELSVYAFYMLGGMVALIGVLFESYQWWPMTELLPQGTALLERFVQVRVSSYVGSLARIAAPILLTLMLIDLGFGLLTKTAEKLEPNGMAQPVKGAVALLMTSMLLAVFFRHFQELLALQDLGRDLRALFGGR